jgi:streptomycin 6-kinase
VSSRRTEVPEMVRRKAVALGPAGHQWLARLPSLLSTLEGEWGIHIGAAFAGGSAAYVAPALTAQGRDVVLKVALPDGLEGNSPFATELRTLTLGAGRGLVEVLERAADGRAIVMERLGPTLTTLGWPVESQIDAIADTVSQVWHRPGPGHGLRSGKEQAQWLAEFVRTTWDALGRPCPAATVEQAVQHAARRANAFDATTAVLIHGDAHPANVLVDPVAGADPPSFKLIDPDGMLSEPAHDLGVMLRDWSAELLAADALEVGRAWCARSAARTGADAQAIWEWAFVERVSTGLFLTRLGEPHGRQLLEVAARWTAPPQGIRP